MQAGRVLTLQLCEGTAFGNRGKKREKLKYGPDRLDLYQKFSRNSGELQRSNRIKMLETRAKQSCTRKGP